jgi:transposase
MFAAGISARTAASLCGIHHNSAALFFHKIREAIEGRSTPLETPGQTEKAPPQDDVLPLLCILKGKNGFVTQIMANLKKPSLARLYGPGSRPYGIVYIGAQSCYKTIHISKLQFRAVSEIGEPPATKALVIGAQNFWLQIKKVLERYNQIPRDHFHLFLREAEFRANVGTPLDGYETLKKWMHLR